MAYTKRMDGRKFDELREMDAKVGVVKSAQGSAMFKIGKTIAIAAVRGPKEVFPRSTAKPDKGTLRCLYNMMAFSGAGERVRPGPSRRSKEISMVTGNALLPVLDLSEFPKAGIEIHIDMIQTDAGTRCAGICAASLALADAGFPMKDMVCGVAMGVIDGTVVADLDKAEEDYDKGPVADIAMAMLPRTGEVTLLQLDGEASQEKLSEAIKLMKKSSEKIYEVQKKALLEKYGGSKNE